MYVIIRLLLPTNCSWTFRNPKYKFVDYFLNKVSRKLQQYYNFRALANSLIDSDSEFEDDEDYTAELEDDEDIYQDVDNIYDAPSLRCSSLMTSSNGMMTSDEVASPTSLPSPLGEGSSSSVLECFFWNVKMCDLLWLPSVMTVITFFCIKC